MNIRGYIKELVSEINTFEKFQPSRGNEVRVEYENGLFPEILCV